MTETAPAPMFEEQTQDPNMFIQTLREFHETPTEQRGQLANHMSDLIVGKRVDLGAVRQELLKTGLGELIETLDRLVDLIEPYIEEGGVEE